jgi:hypothetical protein
MDIQGALDMASRIINASLRSQAPVKSGALKDSIEVRAIQNGDTIEFVSSYLTYGIFVDLGTLEYLSKEVGRPWDPNPSRTGDKKGIAPRFWTTLEESIKVDVIQIVKEQIEKEIVFTLTNKFKTNE